MTPANQFAHLPQPAAGTGVHVAGLETLMAGPEKPARIGALGQIAAVLGMSAGEAEERRRCLRSRLEEPDTMPLKPGLVHSVDAGLSVGEVRRSSGQAR